MFTDQLTSVIVAVGMALAMLLTGLICAVWVWLEGRTLRSVNKQQRQQLMHAWSKVDRLEGELAKEQAARRLDQDTYNRRVDRWRNAFNDLHVHALEMARLLRWQQELTPRPQDTGFSDLDPPRDHADVYADTLIEDQ